MQKIGEGQPCTENTKSRAKSLGDFANEKRGSARYSRARRCVAATVCFRNRSRRRSMARLRRLLDLELGQGGLAELGRYLRPPRRAGQANREDHARPLLNSGRLRLRHEVEDAADRWAPPVGDSGRGPALLVEEERGLLGAGEKAGPRLLRALGREEEEKGGEGSGPSGRIP